MSNIKISNPVIPSNTNQMLDKRTRVNTVEDIQNIENPAIGLLVYCVEDGSYYTITGLKDKTINGKTVPNAAVDTYEALDYADNPYTAFAVYPTSQEIAAGGYEYRGYTNNKYVIPAMASHTVNIRSSNAPEDQDVYIDWGDGTIEYLSDHTEVNKSSTGEYTYRITHEYEVTDTEYIVKIYGSKYWGVRADENANNTGTNIMSRAFDPDLPVAPNVSNLASFCRGSRRILYIDLKHSTALDTVINWAYCFSSCLNMHVCIGWLRSKLDNMQYSGSVFYTCPSLGGTDFRMATCPVDYSSTMNVFRACTSLSGDVSEYLPISGFRATSMKATSMFKNSKVTISDQTYAWVASQLWNNRDIVWTDTMEAFTGCPTDTRNKVPKSWGGTADDSIIHPSILYKYEREDLISDTVDRVSENMPMGGVAIGSIFVHSSSVPPEGAYLLNGQTIGNCAELYPQFWEWLMDNSGDVIKTPVYKPWTMPALTADGTVGGTDYATEAGREPIDGCDAYKSFDGIHGGSNTFCAFSGDPTGWLTWYSPVKLKFNQIVFQNSTVGEPTRRPASFVISGSNDNVAWTELASGAYNSTADSATQTVEIPKKMFNADTPGYHYLKIEMVNAGYSNGVLFPEITIYGEEYLYTDYPNNGNVLLMSNEAYEHTLAMAGVCGGFAIDTVTGSVRLPKWHYQSPLGETLPVLGNGTVLGLTNGTETAGLTRRGSTGAYLNGDQDMYGDSVEKLQVDAANEFYGKIGVTTDPDNSGIVAENNAPTDHFVWCIQVFNAATVLSEQESAQLASQMQTKAQLDFGNVAENLDFIIKHEEAADGSWWYDIYRSGKVVQGGVTPDVTANRDITINLPIEMADTKYTPLLTINGRTDSVSSEGTVGFLTVFNLTTTNFQSYSSSSGFVKSKFWRVEGKAATE